MSGNKSKVVMYGWELPPHNTGGMGVACQGLLKGLDGFGVSVSFALPKKLGAVPFARLTNKGLKRVQVTGINSLMRPYMGLGDYAQRLAMLPSFVRRRYEGDYRGGSQKFADMASYWSKDKKFEVVHAHDWMTYSAGIKTKKSSGVPLVAHVHSTEYDRTGGSLNSEIAEVEYQGLKRADKVIAVSEYTKKIVNRYYSVPNEKITVVHNGVDLEEFVPVKLKKMFPDDKIVLYVGRLTLQKGVEYFLRSAQKVLKVRPNTIFLVVGSGDMEGRLMMEAAQLGISERVVFTGFLSGDRLKACYQLADAFVMPSVSEPYGLVALEAIASGVPAIISKQSGVSENISNALRVDFWDLERMAVMMLAVFEYPGLAKAMVKRAKKEAAKQTWKWAAYKTLKVYESLTR